METKKLQAELDKKTKTHNELKALYKKATGKEYVEGEPVKTALAVSTDAGQTLEIDDADGNGVPSVGDLVSLDGQPTPDQSYTLADGMVIKTDADSKISEVTPPVATTEEEIIVDGKKVKVAKEVAIAFKKQQKEVSENKVALGKLAQKDADIEKITAELKKATSTFTPPPVKLTFAQQHEKKVTDQEQSVLAAAEKRKKESAERKEKIRAERNK